MSGMVSRQRPPGIVFAWESSTLVRLQWSEGVVAIIHIIIRSRHPVRQAMPGYLRGNFILIIVVP